MPGEDHLPDGWGWLGIVAAILGVVGGLVTAVSWSLARVWNLAHRFTVWTEEHEGLKRARQKLIAKVEKHLGDLPDDGREDKDVSLIDRVAELEHAVRTIEKFTIKRALTSAERKGLVRKKEGESDE